MDTYFERYARQMMMPDFTREKQQKLREATVFLGGIGGLGGAAAQCLAVAGIGKLILAHYGNLTETNMNRQTLMEYGRIGQPRVEIAVDRLRQLSPDLEVVTHNVRLNDQNTVEMVCGANIAISSRPNFPERMALNNACLALGIPMVEAAMDDMSGYLFTVQPRITACLGCMVPPQHDDWDEMGFGVLGAVSNTIGCLAAVEAIKQITGHGETLDGKMMHIDFLRMRTITPALRRNPECVVCGAH
ncbi:HesA/MoeB/ThiF family protein [Chrysiogenes arsenatis]|uniref:HesA/MoeB/ThiF family protein n=1 Tax=Chrysiogenes arsenatis TaxID=309797 RepID=UPI0004082E31|nr:HesA/MoeB/ThiF family protein [Chrysiogenes arsenatis]